MRFSDVDVYGHVNNVKYFEYFQEARIQLLADLGRPAVLRRAAPASWSPRPTSTTACRSSSAPSRTTCWARVAHVGTRSFTIESEIRDGDTLLSRARVVMVFFDPETGRSAEPPAAVPRCGRLSSERSSKVLTMNCAAWVT